MVETSVQSWWKPLGRLLDAYELPLLNPFDPDYPVWPQSDRALLLIDTVGGSRLVTTDGLGGAGLPEYVIEISEPLERLDGHWTTNLLLELGRFIPSNVDGVADLIRRQGPVTLSLGLQHIPTGWRIEDRPRPDTGQVGLILGLPRAFPTTERELIHVMLLRPAELHYCLHHGPEGRARIAQLLSAPDRAIVSDLERGSVI